MPYYEWVGQGRFIDNRHDRVLEHGDVVELPERYAQRFDFKEVEEPGSDDETPTPDADESEDSEPLEDKDYSELRSMAVDADTDEIDGRSSKDEIIAYFSEE